MVSLQEMGESVCKPASVWLSTGADQHFPAGCLSVAGYLPWRLAEIDQAFVETGCWNYQEVVGVLVGHDQGVNFQSDLGSVGIVAENLYLYQNNLD